MNLEAVPDEIRDRDQWICWRTECRECSERLEPAAKTCPECGEKATKKPIDPGSGGFASSTDPETWATLAEALDFDADNPDTDGIGYVFDANGLVAGVDLDDCRDAETGEIDDWAAEVVDRLDSFTEVSPSGTGLHVYVFGFVPDGGNREPVGDGELEMYDSGRYFTVTGQHVDGTPETVEQRSETLTDIHSEYIETEESQEPDAAGETEVAKSDGKLSYTNEVGDSLEEIRDRDGKLDRLLSRLNPGDYGGDTSRADMAAASKLWFWRFDERQISKILRTYRSREKVRERDDYVRKTIGKVKGGERYEPAKADGVAKAASPPGDGTGTDDSAVIEKFRKACTGYHIKPNAIATYTDGDGNTFTVSIADVFDDLDFKGEDDLADAVLVFNRDAERLTGTDKQAIIGRVVYDDLADSGEFFKTSDGRLFYYHGEERDMYRVDGGGNRILDEDFQGFVWGRYNLFAGNFSRNLGKDIRSVARREAPEKDVYQFAHFDPDTAELYVSDWGTGYYAVSPDGIESRPNGTDLYFLPDDHASGYDYVDPEDRQEMPPKIPGELSMWQGSGDAIMRVFGNRINYDEHAALGPAEQRKQLYLHLHTLPFIDVLNSRPITAWAGEKGSGKTVIQRSVGRFIYGEDYTESILPDSREDFLAKVTNQALAFVDNYDDGEAWANDVLAAIATGAGLDKRELYTTNELRRERPRCWLSLTSRDPPFRRDDVADRTLVFRVTRFENAFIGMGDFLREVETRRNLLWSVYLDNLQAVVEEYAERDTGSMSSSHRMADWAIFAKIVADALDVDGIDDLLDMMETERAVFALESEDWAGVVGDWVSDNPETAAQWREASTLAEDINEWAEADGRGSPGFSPQGVGGNLSQYENELRELYGLEIDDSGSPNQYRFDAGGDTGAVGLDKF